MTVKVAAGISPRRSSNVASSSSSSSPSPTRMKKNNDEAASPSPSPSSYSYHQRYLKPGALAKLRDSKITATYRTRRRASLSKLLLLQLPTTTTTTQQQHIQQEEETPPLIDYQQENGLPCFETTRTTLISHPPSLHRKKLFAVTPFFTHPDDTQTLT